MTEGDESFIRITATDDNAYIYGNKYPVSVSSDTKFCIIKYRTSSEKAADLGVIYKSTSLKQYDLSEAAYETVVADGNWHYLYIDMSGETNWQDWIVSMGIVPFLNVEGAAGESVDIAWIKFYNDDPWDIEEYENDRNAISKPTEEPTTEEVTTEEVTTEQATEEQTTETPKQEKGCGGIVGAGALVAIIALGACVITKKKD